MNLSAARAELVAANRVLGHEGILDEFGHVSLRHPDDPTRYLISRARSAAMVEESDLIEYLLDGTPVTEQRAAPYLERFIHGAIYEVRPDVMAVVHNHTVAMLPFSISRHTRLKSVIHQGAFLGGTVPVWDIADHFGPETDLLVRNMDQGRSLSRTLDAGPALLMRAHGSVVVGADLSEVVQRCIGMEKNARVQLQATALGEMIELHPGECRARTSAPKADDRAWEYWTRRAQPQA